MSRIVIATWNVNSIRTRLERFMAWLVEKSPDVLCLQETKVIDADFPREVIEAAGYKVAIFGQKTYNGVALLSKTEAANVVCGFADGEPDVDARLIAGTFFGVRVISAYFPNGSTVGSEKYVYKRAWIERLRRYLDRTAKPTDRLALLGDFNIAPADIDIANPEKWRDGVLANDEIRADLERLRSFGFVDVFRAATADGSHYSWWDYQNLGFPKNDGLRIDHVFATPPLAEKCTKSWIDRDQRRPKAGPEGSKPSDHAPVLAEFEID